MAGASRTFQAPRAVRVAQNIIKSYGYEKFILLLDHFRKGTSGSLIAEEMQVSKQRIHQWKTTLGVQRKLYVLTPELEEFLEEGLITHRSI